MKTYRLNSNLFGLKYGDTFQSDDDAGWAKLVKNGLISIEGEDDASTGGSQPFGGGGPGDEQPGAEDAATGGGSGSEGEGELPFGDGGVEELDQGDDSEGVEGEDPVDLGGKRPRVRRGR